MYEFFEHTADVGLRVQTTTLDQLFADAARGLFSMVAPNLDAVQGVLERRYELTGEEYDYLLFDWLNELLFTFETEHLVLAYPQVKIDKILPNGLI